MRCSIEGGNLSNFLALVVCFTNLVSLLAIISSSSSTLEMSDIISEVKVSVLGQLKFFNVVLNRLICDVNC